MKILNYYKSNSYIWKSGFWLMVVFGVFIPYWKAIKGFIDFPCYYYGIPEARLQIQVDTRIAYCISYCPRGVGGGAVYTNGVSNENRIYIPSKSIVDEIVIERDQNVINVNGKVLLPHDDTGFEKTFTPNF